MDLSNRIAIVGSGLTAIVTAEALIARGLRPVIIDVGKTLEPRLQNIASKMSELDPQDWDLSDINSITQNSTLDQYKNTPPLKLLFGSNYFYGGQESNARIGKLDMPPFSYAKGGFSNGWGASALPADPSDLDGWPTEIKNLDLYYRKVLKNRPYSAVDDALSEVFPIHKDSSDPISLAQGNLDLLKKMKQSIPSKPGEVLFGQARVMVRALAGVSESGCQYCGRCMGGCVYDAIYKSNQTLDQLIKSNSVDYLSGCMVSHFQESEGKVEILFKNKENETSTLKFNKVFLAAGVVNSTRIILKSKRIYDKKVIIKTVAAYIVPMISKSRFIHAWPKTNTLSGIFLEFKSAALKNYWAHCQISTPNELVLKKIGFNLGKKNLFNSFLERISQHLVIGAGTLHSSFGNGYEILLKQGNNEAEDILVSNRQDGEHTLLAINLAIKELANIMKKIHCYPLPFLALNYIKSNGYHIGGSMPMKSAPEFELDTDINGVPKGMKNIHVVDSSIFPSIPGTTIGLLSMANACRIASTISI